MKLYFVRHAQSESNKGIHTGKETVLSETGIEQAKRLGKFFQNKKINKIYCSKLIRAKDTLKEIKPFLSKIPIDYTKQINEQSKGIYESKPHQLFKEARDAAIKSGLKHKEMFRPPRGENLLDLEKRAQKFLDLIKKKHQDKIILVVSHGMFGRVLINRILGFHIKEIQYYDLHNASVSYFEINKNGKVKNFYISDYKHLIQNSSYKRKEYAKPSLG